MDHPTTPRDTARAEVRRLADQGLSNRAIARRVGVSESTVRRWRKADAPPTQNDAPDNALTVPLDDDLREHLAVLTDAGHTPEEAVAAALEFLADAYRSAWDFGDHPRGTPPDIRAHALGAPCPGHLAGRTLNP